MTTLWKVSGAEYPASELELRVSFRKAPRETPKKVKAFLVYIIISYNYFGGRRRTLVVTVQ